MTKTSKKCERAKLWRASIGLQAVDNLRVSSFLIETARKHIEGLISMDEVHKMIDEHYAQTQAIKTRLNTHLSVLSPFSYSKFSNNCPSDVP